MGMSAIYNYIFNVEVLVGSEALTGGYRAIALEGGIFGDPNDLALLLITALPFAGYYLLIKEKKILPLLGVLVIAAGVMLTHSRAGFLGLCVTGLAFLYFFGKTQKRYIVLFLGLAVLLWSVAPESYKERIGTITAWEKDEETGLTGTRMDSWMVAMAEGLKNPVLGVGAGSGVYVMGQTSRDWHDVHNAFVQVFLEIGGFGFIAYLLLFVIPFKQRKLFIGNMDDSLIKLDILYKAMTISFISYAATAFFTPQAYSPLLYTLTGFSVIALELMRKQTSSVSVRKTEVPKYRSRTRELQGAGL
jgi:O-antigen ligase